MGLGNGFKKMVVVIWVGKEVQNVSKSVLIVIHILSEWCKVVVSSKK